MAAHRHLRRSRLRRPRGSTTRSPASQASRSQLKVFLDCDDCYSDFLQSEIEFVDYVRDRTEAEVHVLITRAQTGERRRASTRSRSSAAADSQDVTDTLKTVTESSDTDDIIRRQLATSVRAGLLRFLTRDAVPPRLAIEVKLGSEQQRPAVAGDRWNNWVFSLRGLGLVRRRGVQPRIGSSA